MAAMGEMIESESERTDLEELDDVAGAEDAVSGGELVGLGGREVGSQDAAVDAAAAEDLARRAGAQHHGRRRRRGGRRGRRGSTAAVRQRSGGGSVARGGVHLVFL